MTQDQPLLAVQEALKQCFPVVEEQQGLWQSALSDCQPLLLSLSNLAEQLQAAQNLRFEDVPPLRAFPDLKERLRRKQLWAGDTVLDKLEERLTALLKVRDTVSSHVERVLQTYEQHADTIGMDGVLQASVVSPSVADMLEWLQDIERHYRNSYLKRKCLLSSIQWGDLANIQALPKAWDRISEDEHQTLVQAVKTAASVLVHHSLLDPSRWEKSAAVFQVGPVESLCERPMPASNRVTELGSRTPAPL
uniref:Dynein heavy chain tail domain-containing protein n=1 Tax=Felis catus TaxID=9685 RepID=A0ABI7YHS4_FELCA